MAVKASATITLTFMIDVTATYRYYKLQASTASAPSIPTARPPSGWTDAEPSYTSGSTNTLYFVDCTVFSNNTFLYSTVSKSSSYEAAKEAYNKAVAAGNTANTANNTANSVKTDISNRDSNYGYKYSKSITVYGDSNKFYPVIIKSGSQTIMREIMVIRNYSAQAPSDWNNSTHKGGLTLKLRCNFGGWGGVSYSWAVTDFEESYSHVFGGADIVASGMMFAIFLRGGGETGAIYTLYSDQSLTEKETSSGRYEVDADGNIVASDRPSPQIAYESDLIFCQSTGNYKMYAPDPRVMVTGYNGDSTKYKRTDSVETSINSRCYIKNSRTAIKSVDVEYYLSTSQTSLAGGSWSTTAPTWVTGKYMWSRTKTTLQNGTISYSPSTNGVCIAGAKGDTGSTGTGISSITEEYYLSTSKTSQTGGSWVTTPPTWSAGKYIWTRSKIVYANPSSTKYTTPICDSSWEAVNEVEVGGRNLLSDTYVPSLTKKAAPANRYLSDSGNSIYMTGAFVAVDNLPIPEFTHVYQFTCSTASTTATHGRSLCFYQNSNIPMIDGEVYTMSMYARKTSGNGRIRFIAGSSSYMGNYNGLYDVTTEWKRYSWTFTYTDDATGGTDGTRLYFGAQASLIGVVQTFGWKLEKGNKATDWSYSAADIAEISNYMHFDDLGLVIGNMKAETLGKNVLIDNDSVDIRNGTQVLASYGENIVMNHDGKEAFGIRTDVDYLSNATKISGTISGTYPSRTFTASSVALTSGAKRYIDIGDSYTVLFTPNVTGTYTVAWDESTKIVTVSNSSGTVASHRGMLVDPVANTKVTVKGRLVIGNSSDADGKIAGAPPVLIGDETGEHILIDGNEIMAKDSKNTPGNLAFNYDGGSVTFNSGATRGVAFIDGNLSAKYKGYSNDNWYEALCPLTSIGRLHLGYGLYEASKGVTAIYGNELEFMTKNYIKSNRKQKILWSHDTGWFMNADQSIELADSIANQLNGIILVWSAYVSDTEPGNYDFNFIFIPKQQMPLHAGKGVAMHLTNSSGSAMCTKYLYINYTTIAGNAANNRDEYANSGMTNKPKYFVLRYVLGV